MSGRKLAPGRTVVRRTCEHCGVDFDALLAEVRLGRCRFCSRACSGARRRMDADVKRAKKAEYDRQRRAALGEALLQQKRESYYANREQHLARMAEIRSDPEYRERHRAYIAEYQSRPEWKEHKRSYDRRYRCERQYGDFAEAASVLIDLEAEIRRACPDRSVIYQMNGTQNKHTRRHRNASSEAQRRRSQGHPVGHPPFGEGGQDGPGRG